MLEIGIPVWKSRNTLPAALDSLVAQTKKNFIVCLSIDGDGENYSDIIETYQNRGLYIRVINGEFNGGPGVARQRVLDTTQCDYISFLDSDDMFMPRAVEVLYTQAKLQGYDIVKSSFIREIANGEDQLMFAEDNLVTWFHGKIYRVSFLKEKNIRFRDDLRTDEDAYFNAVAWNSTQNKGLIKEVLYIWRANKNSLTRFGEYKDYFIRSHMNYIKGQIEALKYLHIINEHVIPLLITNTLINVYYYYMQAKFYNCDIQEMEDCISTYKQEEWVQKWLADPQNWIDAVNNVKSGKIYENQYVIFFDENFYTWCNRLMKGD